MGFAEARVEVNVSRETHLLEVERRPRKGIPAQLNVSTGERRGEGSVEVRSKMKHGNGGRRRVEERAARRADERGPEGNGQHWQGSERACPSGLRDRCFLLR